MRDALACAGLFALAVIVRILFLRGTVDRELPFSIFYYGDSRLYREFALALLRGDLFDQGIPYHPPLFAYLLALVIRFVGENPAALRAVLAVVAASAVPLTYLLGRRLWDTAIASTAAMMAVFSFGLSVMAVSANAESIYVPLLVAQVLAVLRLGRALENGGGAAALRASAMTGILLGLSSLTRAEHLAFAALVPLALVIGWPGAGLRSIVKVTGVMLATAAIVIAPWTIHNYRTLSRFNANHPDLAEPLPVFVLVSNYGGLNFALANGPGADGTFKPDAIVSTTGGDQLDLRDPRQLGMYLHGYRRGLAWLAADPASSAQLVARKLSIGLEALSLGFGLSDRPGGLSGQRRAVDMLTPDSKLWLPVAMILTAAGLWLSRASWRRGSIVWLAILHKVVICAAFFGYVRLFVPLLPFVFLLQASALTASVRAIPWKRGRLLAAGLGLTLTVALLVELFVHAQSPLNFEASGSSDPANGKLIQDAPMTLKPRR